MTRRDWPRPLCAAVVVLWLAACAEQPSQPGMTLAPMTQLTVQPGGPTMLLGHAPPTGLPAPSLPPSDVGVGILATTTFVRFARSAGEGGGFVEMPVGGTAYFRDVAFAMDAVFEADADGEFWDADIVVPGGGAVTFLRLTYRSEFNGEQDCWVAGFQSLCGSTVIFVSYILGIQCQRGGVYTGHIFENGGPVFEGSFTLKPTLPPGTWTDHFQTDFPDDPYNTLCVDPDDPASSIACGADTTLARRTIAEKGCALTAGTMLLSYFGVQTDPSALNDYLLGLPDGFIEGGVNWEAMLQRAAQDGQHLTYRGKFEGNVTPQDLRNRLCRFGPQIVKVKGRQHFVMVTGLTDNESDFTIADPSRPSAPERDGLLNGDFGGFESVREFEPRSQPGFDEVILATLHSPGELLMTDPLGRQIGFDPLRGQLFNEIPNGAYGTTGLGIDLPDGSIVDEEPWKELSVHIPPDGQYTVTVTGTGTGRYTLHLLGYDRAHRFGDFVARDIPIATGEVHRYGFAYNAADMSGGTLPLAGAFNGGGQRSIVNALLSYARPGESRTSLPAGTTTYSLLVFYDAAIDPLTFQAELNGVAITSRFTPTPGGHEAVEIPLQAGRNVLKLSVAGSPGGRVATDRDQLTFIVP